jgi:ubiquinone/menaquinone biosynthesis C-methylase UbiE
MKLNWAERWAVNNPIRPLQQGLEIRWMKKRIPLRPKFGVLEVGCGRGAGGKIILREFQPAILQAMDLDIRMIQRARAYLSSLDEKKIAFYVGDVSNLPYRNQVLDAIFGFGVLHHVPDWQRALAEISRVLKSGGFYFMEELYPSLYQNFITRHILLHPRGNRFRSLDLKEALKARNLHLVKLLEHSRLGILGISLKEQVS